MVQSVGPDSLLTCPLDESHRILRSRMQFHMVRCSKNHILKSQMKCPWNPLHIVDKFSYENHYKRECEDMPGAVSFLCATDGDSSHDVGSVPPTATNGLMPHTDENWDADPHVGTYDPIKNAESKPVLRVPIGMSKAKKKAWRMAERKRFQELEEKGPIQAPSRPPEKFDTSLPPVRNIPPALTMTTVSEKHFDDEKNISKNKCNPRRLRTPHEPSPALSYKENLSKIENDERPKTIRIAGKSSVTSENDFAENDELPNLCRAFDNTFLDAASKRSSVSSSSNVDDRRRALEKVVTMGSVRNGAAGRSVYDENSIFLDEAAGPPNLVAPIEETSGETIYELKQRLAAVAAEKMRLEEMSKLLIRQISEYDEVPNLVSSNVSVASFNTREDGKMSVPMTIEKDFPPIDRKPRYPNGIPKCAANFSKFSETPNFSGLGMTGRDSGLDRDSQKYGQSGTARKEINEEATVCGNAGQRSYRSVVIRSDDEDSNSAYEKSD